MTEAIRRWMLLALLATLAAAPGCSARQMAASSLGDALADGGDATVLPPRLL